MKIGIITLPTRTNYGGILQAYALSLVLRRMGHDVQHIYTPVKWRINYIKYPYIIFKRIIKNILRKQHNKIFLEFYLNKTYPRVSKYTQKFIDINIPYIEIKSFTDIKEKDFDTFIVGSDQVWRPLYFHNIEQAFLKFAKNWNVKRIAYAVSFGTDKWEYTHAQTKECKRLINLFDIVSVREASAIKLCNEQFETVAQHVLDPTLLLTAEDYISLFRTTNVPKSKGTLLNYILDETKEKETIINNIAKQKKLIPFRVNSKIENLQAPISERIQPPVEQWLRGFYDAEFVITDSFHACVFSIIFNKPFIVIGNNERGMARFHSLLSMFKLEKCLLLPTNKATINDISIDWNFVNKKRDEMIRKSLNILTFTFQ